MANISRGKIPRPGPTPGDGATLAGVGALIGLPFAGVSIWAVFAASASAGGALVVVVAVLVLLAALVGSSENPPRVALALLLLAGLWAMFAGYIVFEWHMLAFTPAAWVLNALFAGALLAGAWRRLKAWGKSLAALLAGSLLAATVLLPRPPGGEGPFDTSEKWKVDVAVTDEADNRPLDQASVLCGTVMRWKNRLKLADTGARETGADGRATWEFEEDPRLKIVICTAWKNADETNAGYPAASRVVLAPAGGGKYELDFALNENPHPDTAFLAIDLSGRYQDHVWYYLDFEVWRGEPRGGFGDRDGPQPLLRKSWQEMGRPGFALDSADARGALTLRYRYEGPAGPDLGPPYSESRVVDIGPIPGGGRKRIALSIPAGQAAN